jgi:phosphinothricin acetyltransferase
MAIRPATVQDAAEITAIYNHYIEHTVITFEELLVDVNEMQTRINQTSANFPYLVYEREGSLVGYAYATQWRPRSAYRHSVEVTIYLQKSQGGLGVGSALYSELVTQLRQRGFRTAIGGIALPNAASVALHEKLGFEKVGHIKQVGFKFEQWIDVGYWQLML